MNEIPDLLNGALAAPLELQFDDPIEARSWVYRAHNYINRHAPELKQLMISRRDNIVRVKRPNPVILER